MKYKQLKFLSSVIFKSVVLYLLLLLFVQNFIVVNKDTFHIHDLLGGGIWSSGLLNTSYTGEMTPNFVKLIVLASIFLVQYGFTLMVVGNIIDFGKNMFLYHSSHKYNFFWKLIRSAIPIYIFETIVNVIVIISFYMIHSHSDKNVEMLLQYMVMIGGYILAVSLYFTVIIVMLKNSLLMFCAMFIIIIFQQLLFTLEMVLALVVCIVISFSKIGNYLRADEV